MQRFRPNPLLPPIQYLIHARKLQNNTGATATNPKMKKSNGQIGSRSFDGLQSDMEREKLDLTI